MQTGTGCDFDVVARMTKKKMHLLWTWHLHWESCHVVGVRSARCGCIGDACCFPIMSRRVSRVAIRPHWELTSHFSGPYISWDAHEYGASCHEYSSRTFTKLMIMGERERDRRTRHDPDLWSQNVAKKYRPTDGQWLVPVSTSAITVGMHVLWLNCCIIVPFQLLSSRLRAPSIVTVQLV